MKAKASSRSALIVESNPDDMQRMKKFLEDCGFAVATAVDSQEVRTRMKFQEFNLLVIDMNQQKENGVQLLTSLHESASRNDKKEFPAVIMTCSIILDVQLAQKLMRFLGVKLILTKPVPQESINSFVESKFGVKARTHAYDAATINKFLSSTRDIISLNTKTTPMPGKAFVRTDAQALGEFTGIIEIRSLVQQGFVALSFERQCCEILAQKIFQEAAIVVNDAILRDISGEMCNQVVGNVQAQFQREGTRFEVSVPTLVSGVNYQINHQLDAPTIVIPFDWSGTKFYTQFVMAKRDPNQPVGGVLKPKEEAKEGGTMDSGDINFL